MPTRPPPRICYILSHFHPHASGAERQALAQGSELVRRGHVVRVVTRSIPGQPKNEVLEGVKIHRWIRTSDLGPLFGLSFVAGVVTALRRLRSEYDLIHTHQGLWEAIASGVARPLLAGVPTLIQPASSGYYGEAEELARTRGFPLLRRLALRNTAFAAISLDIERQWLALGVPSSKMIRMASGVDSSHFRPGPADSRVEATLPSRPRVVFTGRLHPQKNLGVLLEAWPAVAASVGAHLILVGDGEDRANLVSRARELGVSDHVHFAGRIDDPAEYLRAADVFVLPSVAEGMSNSLLEAMSTGLPCLASDIGGNTDLLGRGEAGLLIAAADPHAWAVAITHVISGPEFAHMIGAAARRRIETGFSLEVVVDRYQELYRRLLSGEFPPREVDSN
jgi:glycosyltransferase involved in cell wall biosynthesis